MKTLLYTLILVPSLIFGQVKKDNNIKEKVEASYFLNNQKIDFHNVYLNTENIESINIIKEGNGKVILNYNKNTPLTKLTDLSKVTNLKNIIFIINNKIINKPSTIQIDETEIATIEITNSSKIENLDSEINIVKITTKTKQKEINSNKKIYLRG